MPALAHAATLVAAASSRASTPRASGGVSRTAPRRHPRHHVATPPERAGARRAVVARLGDFEEIDAESQDAPGGVAEGRFGPDAILLVGFTPEETCKWRAELDAIEADFVRLVTCTKDMVDGPLGVELETEQEDPAAETSAFGVERMMFFSGMVGGEIMQLVDLFNGLGWPPEHPRVRGAQQLGFVRPRTHRRDRRRSQSHDGEGEREARGDGRLRGVRMGARRVDGIPLTGTES